MEDHLKASMELHRLISNSNGASRLLRRASMVHHLQVNTAPRRQGNMERRPNKGSTVHLLHKVSTGRHHHQDSMERRHRSKATGHHHQGNINRLRSSNSTDLQTSHHLDTGLSRPRTLMFPGMSRLFARP